MSGRTAHVQVKNWVTAPTVVMGTLRGWVSSGASGIPTFVVIPCSEDPNKWRYIGPGELAALLENNLSKDDHLSVTMIDTLPFPDTVFHHLLDLWTWNPQMTMVGRFDRIMVMQSTPELAKAIHGAAVDLAAQLLTAWVADHDPLIILADADEIPGWLDDFTTTAGEVLYPEKSQKVQRENFRSALEASTQSGYFYQGERAGQVGRNAYSHLYTTSSQRDKAYADAKEKLTIICKFLIRAM